MITLYSKPRKGAYRVIQSVEYGKPFHLPAPFDIEIDSATFPKV